MDTSSIDPFINSMLNEDAFVIEANQRLLDDDMVVQIQSWSSDTEEFVSSPNSDLSTSSSISYSPPLPVQVPTLLPNTNINSNSTATNNTATNTTTLPTTSSPTSASTLPALTNLPNIIPLPQAKTLVKIRPKPDSSNNCNGNQVNSNCGVEKVIASATASVSIKKEPQPQIGFKKDLLPSTITNSNSNSMSNSMSSSSSSASAASLAAVGKKRKISESQTVPNSKSARQEDEIAKRQQRLIKNREAASISRQKRKQHLQNLETKVSELEKENSDLKKKLEALESKNRELMGRVSNKQVVPKAGAVVMVLFFSFALFLRPLSDSHVDHSQFNTMRGIQSINPSEPKQEIPKPILSVPLPPAKDPIVKNETEEYLPFDNDFEESHTLVPVGDLQSWIDQKINIVEEKNSVILSTDPSSHYAGYFARRSDVAYMFCSHVHQILPNEKDSNGKPRISLLVPYDASDEGQQTEKIIQIDCEVLGTKTLFKSKPEKAEPIPMHHNHNTTIKTEKN